MKKLTSLLLTVVLGSAILLTGCGVSTDKSSTSSEKESVTSTKKNPYSDELKIGFIPNVIGDSLATAWGNGIKSELSMYKNINFQAFDGKASSETQVQIMQDLINQKYDAIILQANDASALAGSVKNAEEAGIPVITLNLDANTPHSSIVMMADYDSGMTAAESMAKKFDGKDSDVVIIQSPPGASRGENTEKGFRDGMKKYSNVKIVDAQDGQWLTEKGNEIMRDFLTKYSKIDGVFAINDAMAEGAAQAVEAAGRSSEVQIWGTDGEKKALEYIEQGKITGTIYTNAIDQGKTAARFTLYSIGSEADSSKFTKTPVVEMAPTVVTKENVGSIIPANRW